MSQRYDASRGKRRAIGKRTVREMLRLKHFAFRQRLLHLAAAGGVDVVVAGEEYTSKTCGHCGEVRHTLGGAKTFRCLASGCGVVADRDVNGARNIYVKNHHLV